MKRNCTYTLIVLLIATLFTSITADAQVKIGSNPTIIGPNSNLEVQATNGNKVIVNKDNGTVIIQNTPVGATTDKLMTVDATGNVRAITPALMGTVPYYRGSGSKPVTSEATSITLIRLESPVSHTENFSNGITFNESTGRLTVNQDGVYAFSYLLNGPTRDDLSRNDLCNYVNVNSEETVYQKACGRSADFSETASNVGIVKLKAGEYLSFSFSATRAPATHAGNYQYTIAVYKISDAD